MAGASLLTLLDDITYLLDDVASMSKVAAKKTAGVLGDDLALNAQQVAGVDADRELPVVWAVSLGSLRNKAILVPAALAISAFMPAAITPLLMIGGAYLCFEGAEKLVHGWLHSAEETASHEDHVRAASDETVDLVAYERDKIKGAVRTDFVLSAEIVAITLGTIADKPFMEQLLVLVGISLLMTVGVYGFVAAIVKMDDAGLYLSRRPGRGMLTSLLHGVGGLLLQAAPRLMRILSFAGTVAMFLVGGGIIAHGLPGAHELAHHWIEQAEELGAIAWMSTLIKPTFDGVLGVLSGVLLVVVATMLKKLKRSSK